MIRPTTVVSGQAEDVVALVERLRSDARGAEAWRVMDSAASLIQSQSERIAVLEGALGGIERIAEKHTGISGARSLQTAMHAISHAARASLIKGGGNATG